MPIRLNAAFIHGVAGGCALAHRFPYGEEARMGLGSEDDWWKKWLCALRRALRHASPLVALVANVLTILCGIQVVAGR